MADDIPLFDPSNPPWLAVLQQRRLGGSSHPPLPRSAYPHVIEVDSDPDKVVARQGPRGEYLPSPGAITYGGPALVEAPGLTLDANGEILQSTTTYRIKTPSDPNVGERTSLTWNEDASPFDPDRVVDPEKTHHLTSLGPARRSGFDSGWVFEAEEVGGGDG